MTEAQSCRWGSHVSSISHQSFWATRGHLGWNHDNVQRDWALELQPEGEDIQVRRCASGKSVCEWRRYIGFCIRLLSVEPLLLLATAFSCRRARHKLDASHVQNEGCLLRYDSLMVIHMGRLLVSVSEPSFSGGMTNKSHLNELCTAAEDRRVVQSDRISVRIVGVGRGYSKEQIPYSHSQTPIPNPHTSSSISHSSKFWGVQIVEYILLV